MCSLCKKYDDNMNYKNYLSGPSLYTMYVPQVIYIKKYICTSETKGNILNI